MVAISTTSTSITSFVVGVMRLWSLYVCSLLTNTVCRDVVCASSINTVNGDGNGNDEDEGVDFLLSEAVVVPVSDRFCRGGY